MDREKINTPEPLPILPEKPKNTDGSRAKTRPSFKDSFDGFLKDKVYAFDETVCLLLEIYPKMSMQDAIAMAMIRRAAMGDVHAAMFVRDTVGESPKLQVTDGDKEFTLNISVQE